MLGFDFAAIYEVFTIIVQYGHYHYQISDIIRMFGGQYKIKRSNDDAD